MKSVADYVPHRPPMRLVERILEVGPERAVTEARIEATNPFYRPGQAGVPGWVGLEYLAQTAAVWLGAECERAGRPIEPAFLLSSREFTAHRSLFAEGETLHIEVKPDWMDRPLVAFTGRIVTEAGEPRVEAVFAAYQPEDLDTYLAQNAPETRQ